MSKLQHVSPSTVYENLRVSYGVASILNTFATLSSQARRPAWQIYLINVETLIRNRKENNNSIEMSRVIQLMVDHIKEILDRKQIAFVASHGTRLL